MQKRRLYFAYGSNICENQMAGRCPDSHLQGTAYIKDYRFQINSRGVATIVKDIGKVVYGVLWQISKKDENTLDDFEGVPFGTYHKEEINAWLPHEKTTQTMVYIARDTTVGVARDGYMERIIKAAKVHEFSAAYIKELENALYRR